MVESKLYNFFNALKSCVFRTGITNMIKDCKKFFSVLILCSAISGVGLAADPVGDASLAEFEGKTLVNKGDGLVSAKPGTVLNDGDRVITLDKSSARIVFPDGCSIVLPENNALVINMKLGCKAVPLANTTTPGTGALGGATATGAEALIYGGALLIPGGVAIARNGDRNRDRPISAQ